MDVFLGRIRDELVSRQYRPMRNRRKEIPEEGGKVRVLSIPSIRDRVVQGALMLILEPIFEADFQTAAMATVPREARTRRFPASPKPSSMARRASSTST